VTLLYELKSLCFPRKKSKKRKKTVIIFRDFEEEDDDGVEEGTRTNCSCIEC
jgi:hypothetical protein